jgi:putative peptidoglycan lipid II flippase
VQLLSFASSIALAHVLGASTPTDAYYLALSVPVLVYTILLAAVRLGAIPALTEVSRESDTTLQHESSGIVTAVLVGSIGLSLVVTCIMLVALPAAAGGGHHLAHDTRVYVVELFPYAVTGALMGVLGAILAVRGRFIAASAVMGFEPAIKAAMVIVFGHSLGAQSLVIGNIAGNALAVLCLWHAVNRTGLRLKLRSPRRSPVVRAVLHVSMPLLISQSVLQMNPFVDRTMASSLGRGSVTVFELGQRLFSAPTSLLAAVMIAPLAATWSARLASSGWDAVQASFGRVVSIIAMVLPPLIAVGVVMRHELVHAAYGGGAYSPSDVRRTSAVLAMLLLGLPAQILVVPLSTLFVIQKKTVFPMLVGMANVLLNVGLNFALRPRLGVGGIALSTTLTLTILCGAYAWTAQHRWGALHISRGVKPLIAGALTVGCVVALGPVAHMVLRDSSRVVNLVGMSLIALAAVALQVMLLALATDSLADIGRGNLVPAGVRAVRARVLRRARARVSWS